MSKYTVSNFDVCASGFERLRSYSEFILVAYIDVETSAADLLAQWESDIDSCERPDGFDFDAAREAVRKYHAESIAPLFAKCPDPFDLQSTLDCSAFLYVNVEGAHFPVY